MMDKNENIATQSAVGGMMLRKRVKEGKRIVERMVYVERPRQSRDPMHNMKRDAKRRAAQLAKEQKAEVQKEIKKQIGVFDMYFILQRMNKFAPRGYKFIVVGEDKRIALQATDIMGTQSPRGAFVSDISFDLISCLYGDLLNGKIAGPDVNLYERMLHFLYEKPTGVSQDKHSRYMHIIKNIRSWDFSLIPPFSFKRAPTRAFTKKNAILVQGIMDSGQMPPKFLGNRMHAIVNEMVWWSFRRVMTELKLSRLQQLRKTYRNHFANHAIIPGKKSGLENRPDLANQNSSRQKELEQRLDKLINHTLPQAIAEAKEATVSLHRQMANLVDLQPVQTLNAGDGIKPSKKLKHQIQHEIEDWCAGVTQRQNLENVRNDIRKAIIEINGIPEPVVQPARDLMPGVFYTDSDYEQPRKIGNDTGVLKQLYWLMFSSVSKTK